VLRAEFLLVSLPVPVIKVRARPTEDRATSLTVHLGTGRLGRTVARAVPLDTSFAVTAVPEGCEGTARTAETIERTFTPGDESDAAKNQESPGEMRATLIVADILRLASLDHGVPVPVAVRIVDQPVPTENE